ncbi:hypothetical protein [Streptomyces erythrochromogenes]|uniref:hypothetical protein n=1 Tax=Streptomyces erythrochromogenes TaxID=285574 RepID=UPI003802C5F3
MKIPVPYILGAVVVGLVCALVSMVLSHVGHDPLVGAIRAAAATFVAATSLALLIAGFWPGTRSS